MKKLSINNNEIKVYDSIDEMPIVNFQKYNKYLLIDAGIGSDIDSIDEHIVKIARLIKTDSKKALQELQNMRQNLYMINNNISPRYMAFAALIHSINGKELTDLSDEGLKGALENLQKAKHSAILDFLQELKKKVAFELETYFPEDQANPKEKEAYDKLKSRTLYVLDSIINDTDNSEQIQRIDLALSGLYSPKSFMGSSSVEVQHDKHFEDTCLLIAQKTNMDAKRMTVLQFYNAVENIKKQIEAEAKSLKRYKK